MRFSFRRGFSFLLIAMIYGIAILVGVVSYRWWGEPAWLALLLADITGTLVVFAFSLVFRNASVYGPYWSVQPIVILAVSGLSFGLSTAGLAILIPVTLWGIRLTANWACTFRGLEHQDWRYTMLQERTGPFYPLVNLLGIHLVPTVLVYACVLPAALLIRSGCAFNPRMLPGLLLCAAGTAFELIADWQMHRFRASGRGGLIREGLWTWARHPNYLGEILMWWGVGLTAAAGLGLQWYLFLGAVLNSLLFAFVSIPMADRRQGKKPGYEAYRQQTRALLPIPRRKP